MKLYLAAGKYVGTQADARKLDKSFAQVDVPTDKEGLIAYLNELNRYGHEHKIMADIGWQEPVDDGSDLVEMADANTGLSLGRHPGNAPPPQYQGLKAPTEGWESGADRVLSPADADGIVQRIMGATGYELKRYASAVAQAFYRLGEK